MRGKSAAVGLACLGLLPAPPAGAQTVTFTEHIAPIVFNNCTKCHRPGEATPFPLMSYEDVRVRGPLIASVTGARYMLPGRPIPVFPSTGVSGGSPAGRSN